MEGDVSKILTYPSTAADSQLLYPSQVGLQQLSSLVSASTSTDISGLELFKYLHHFYIARDAVYPELSFYNFKRNSGETQERKRNYSLLTAEGERLFLITDQCHIRGSLASHIFSYNLSELDGRVVFSIQRITLPDGKIDKERTEVEIRSGDGNLLGRLVWTCKRKRCKHDEYHCYLHDEKHETVGYIDIGAGNGLDYPILEAKPSEGYSPKMIAQIFISLRQTIKPNKEMIEDYVLTFYENVPVTTKALAIGAAILMDFALSKVKKVF